MGVSGILMFQSMRCRPQDHRARFRERQALNLKQSPDDQREEPWHHNQFKHFCDMRDMKLTAQAG